MRNRIIVLFLAGGGAELSIEGTFSKQLVAHITALLVAVKRSIDRTILEIDLLVAISSLGLERGIAVAPGDGDFELLTPLAFVGSGVGVDRPTPERALDVGDGIRVRAGSTWGLRGIALNIYVQLIHYTTSTFDMGLTDVEAKTSGLGVTSGSTDCRIVARHNFISQISVSTAGSLQVCKSVEISGEC